LESAAWHWALDEAFLAHRRHMMHGYLNILTPVEMQELDTFASFA
jgi:hypothetical protein